MKLATPLETPRLRLRSLRAEDAAGPYFSWMRDAEIVRFLEVRHRLPKEPSELVDFIEQANAHPTVLFLGVCDLTGRHIGNVKLGATDPHNHRADIGFLIGDRASWGQGYASEAVDCLSDYGLRQLGLNKVFAGCHRSNPASGRVLLKAKFEHEATLRNHWYLDGKPEDGLMYARHRDGVAA